MSYCVLVTFKKGAGDLVKVTKSNRCTMSCCHLLRALASWSQLRLHPWWPTSCLHPCCVVLLLTEDRRSVGPGPQVSFSFTAYFSFKSMVVSFLFTSMVVSNHLHPWWPTFCLNPWWSDLFKYVALI